MILVIDNYDSFTYNLVQIIGSISDGVPVKVYRNDALTLAGIERMAPTRIVISPGPGRPQDAGITQAVIERFGPRIPILGVCLGHQAIGEVYGARLVSASRLVHGKASRVYHCGTGIYKGLNNPFAAGRYHSLILSPGSLPECLQLTAWTAEGEIMGIRHKVYQVEGVQFHPESILTAEGKELLANFLADGSASGCNWKRSHQIGRAHV